MASRWAPWFWLGRPPQRLLTLSPPSPEGPLSKENPTSAADLRLLCAGKFLDNGKTLKGARRCARSGAALAAAAARSAPAPRQTGHAQPLAVMVAAWLSHGEARAARLRWREMSPTAHYVAASLDAGHQLRSERAASRAPGLF